MDELPHTFCKKHFAYPLLVAVTTRRATETALAPEDCYRTLSLSGVLKQRDVA